MVFLLVYNVNKKLQKLYLFISEVFYVNLPNILNEILILNKMLLKSGLSLWKTEKKLLFIHWVAN
ncbi:hypothetical protein D3C80_1379320 [compost metagenome]